MYRKFGKRMFDMSCAGLALIVLSPLFLLICVAIRMTSQGSVLYWSQRVGKNQQIFNLPKFRTMALSTPEVATHLLINPDDHLISIGAFLRKNSLDELPQLWSIFIGDMSFVGPRPVLCNEQELITLRAKKDIYSMTPGLTGWAQINGRDHITLKQKVNFDEEYLQKESFLFDLKIISITLIKVIKREGIAH